MTMTAATPMIMPSAVSAVRMAFRRSALTATTNVIRNDMPAPLRDAAALDGAVVAHQSVAERNHARAVFGDVRLVRHEDDGDAALDVEALEDAHHLDARLRVEIAGRLVGEQQRRVVSQRLSVADTLVLAAGALIGMVAKPVAEAYGLRRVGRALPPLRGGHLARVEQRELDVLDRGCAREQVEPLEHEADLRVAHVREVARRERRHVVPVQEVASGGRPIEAAEQMHERRLAGARRASERDELARRDIQRDAAQRLHLQLAEVVAFRQVTNRDDRVHRPAPPAAPGPEGPGLPATPAPAPRFAFAPPPRRPNGISGDVVLVCAVAPGWDIPVTTWSPSFRSPSTIAVIAPSVTPVRTRTGTNSPLRSTNTRPEDRGPDAPRSPSPAPLVPRTCEPANSEPCEPSAPCALPPAP